MAQALAYNRRIVDDEVDQLLLQLPTLVFEGAKAVGKTATAERRARTVWRLDDPGTQEAARADISVVLDGDPPVLIDEWQRVPASWDAVRRRIDAPDILPASYLLTGSARPTDPETHSGALRMVSIRMRPFSLAERALAQPTVSLASLLSGSRQPIGGNCKVGLRDYVDEIVRSGFPGVRRFTGRALRAQLAGYVDRVVDHDFPEEGGQSVRKPEALRRWMRAYSAAISTTATYEAIREAATGRGQETVVRNTAATYRDILERLWLLEPVPAWQPTRSHINELAHPDKHQVVDPALATSLLGLDVDALITGTGLVAPVPRDGTFLGALFESLITQSVRVYAQASEARVGHLRTKKGIREIDLIAERPDGRIVAVEVKLAETVDETDVRHLKWLQAQIGPDLLDAIVVYTGKIAYRRSDGIAIVPACLLGP